MKKIIFTTIGLILLSIIGLKIEEHYNNQNYILFFTDIIAVWVIYDIFGINDLIDKLKNYIKN